MAGPTIASLCRSLAADLSPAPGFTAPAREVSAVHISELLDPTGYLSGGELLLTTGLSLPKNKIGCERYVGRLVDAGLSALALGLGPVHMQVPQALVAACQKTRLPLLVVPAPTPFLKVTKAYWAAVARSSEQQLKDVLATQRALVEAAASPDPTGRVLRTLSRALDAWSATFTPSGDVDQIHPTGLLEEAKQVRSEIRRLGGAGVHSAASFSIGATSVAVFPMAVEDLVAGYLAVGTTAPLDPTRRRAVLTASALLSLDAVRRTKATSVADEAERCVGLLVELGFPEAARRLAGAVHTPGPWDQVRVLTVRGRDSDVLASTVHRWCGDAIVVREDRHAAWVLLPKAHPPLSQLDSELAGTDAQAVAVVSDVVPVEQTAAVRTSLNEVVATLPAGTRQLVGSRPFDADMVARLGEHLRRLTEPQLVALVAYLRFHGQWEPASRALGVHRNTLRHRLGRCRDLLEVDVDDPDISAELWLLLRRRGVA